MKSIFKWLFLLGLLVAILTGLLGFSASWLSLILVLIGILVAIFYFDSDDIVNFAIRFLALAATAGVLSGLPFVGKYLTGIFMAAVAFLGPIVLTVLVVFFFKKYFTNKEYPSTNS